MSTNKITIKQTLLWYLAIIIEWIIIPFYIASMGYQIDWDLYNKFSNWEHVVTVYYILSCIDILLFGYFILLYKIKKEEKLMQTSVFCCLMQIILLIMKVKY